MKKKKFKDKKKSKIGATKQCLKDIYPMTI